MTAEFQALEAFPIRHSHADPGIAKDHQMRIGVVIEDVGRVEACAVSARAAARDDHLGRSLKVGIRPVEDGLRIGEAVKVDAEVGIADGVAARRRARVDIARTVSNDDEAVIRDRIFRVREIEDARVAIQFVRADRVVKRPACFTGIGVPARAAALKVDHQLVGIGGVDEEAVRCAARTDRVAAEQNLIPRLIEIAQFGQRAPVPARSPQTKMRQSG